MEFTEYLINKKIINRKEFEKAQTLADKFSIKAVEAIFIKSKDLKDSILIAYADFYRVKYSESINLKAIPNLLPSNFLRERNILPINVEKSSIELGISNPFDIDTVKDIEFITGMDVNVHLLREEEIKKTLDELLPASGIDADDIEDNTIEILGDAAANDNIRSMDLKTLADQPPIIRLVNIIIIEAIRKGATDIHIEPQKSFLLIRFRMDGHLQTYAKLNAKLAQSIISRIKIISKMDIAERRKPQDGSLSLVVEENEVDLRVNTIPSLYGEKCVIRLLDKSKFNISLTNLGYNDKAIAILKQMILKPYGIIFVCGPTGSGKTTTLYSLLNELKTVENNIITVEDPIEYKIEGITQVQVNEKGGATFPSALKAILRQDPDIILIGEIRDNETAKIAVQAALTGHLVLSTIHTNDALSVFSRLVSMGISANLIADSVIGVVAQRLVRKVCPYCGDIEEADNELIESKGLISEGFNQVKVSGCSKCSSTGYHGRTVIYEMIDLDEQFKEMILEEKSKLSMFRYLTDNGSEPMAVSALRKVLNGETTLEEIANAVDLRGLRIENEQVVWPPITEVSKKSTYSDNKKILIVDDSKTVRMMLRPVLESEGFDVSEVENGYDCLQYLKNNIADIIIMDLMMPKMNGFEALKIIRETDNISDIPIIMLTTKSELENELKSFDLGVDEFLPKPIMPDKLLARVKRISQRIKSKVR